MNENENWVLHCDRFRMEFWSEKKKVLFSVHYESINGRANAACIYFNGKKHCVRGPTVADQTNCYKNRLNLAPLELLVWLHAATAATTTNAHT